MMATLAVAAALSLAPAQAGELRLTNERATYGYLGPVRKDTKLLAGDAFYLMFDIEGLKVGDTGEVYYRMSMAIKDSKGKDQFKQEPIEQRQLLSLGGARVPAFAHAVIGTDTPPGEYTFEVTVSDPKSKREASIKRKLQVDNKGLGIIRLQLSYDPNGQLGTSTLAVPGQDCWVNFGVVGFQRDGKTKQPDLLAEMVILDDKGKPTLPKPITGEIKEVPEKVQGIPMQFYLARNRTGRFTVQLKVTDRLAKKTVEQAFEINVMEPK
jgi:hypothetical protein